MIDPHDLTQQKQVYSRNGTGRWAVLGYCPAPSVTMVNLETGERLHFGLAVMALATHQRRVGNHRKQRGWQSASRSARSRRSPGARTGRRSDAERE